LFRGTEQNIAFTSNNTFGKRLAIKKETPQNTYDRSCVYQLTCLEFEMKYTGQTRRPFRIRYSEDLRDNKNKSKFPQHFIGKKQPMGTIENIMDLFYKKRKGRMMNAKRPSISTMKPKLTTR
jgi:hypothetical protein